MIGGSYAVYKLTQHDIERIEQETGKPAENLTEEELKNAMRNLNIRKMELTPDDAIQIEHAANETATEAKKFCLYCGAQLGSKANYCTNCGQKV
jgi:hypothetical protein